MNEDIFAIKEMLRHSEVKITEIYLEDIKRNTSQNALEKLDKLS